MLLKVLLGEWADYYFPHLVPKTRSTNTDVIRRIDKYIGDVEVEDIEFDFLQDHFNFLCEIYAPRTIQSDASILKSAFDFYIRKHDPSYPNPADGLLLPQDMSDIKIFTIEEIKLLMAAAKSLWMRDAIYLGYQTGMRRGEAIGLRFDDINFDQKILSVHRTCAAHDGIWYLKPPKTKSSYRDIYLNDATLGMLKRRRLTIRSPFVFPSPKNPSVPLNPIRVTENMRNLCRRLNIEQRGYHSLRHTHATLAIANKCDIKALSQRLGHSSTAITLAIYYHPDPTAQQLIAMLSCFDI